MRATISTATRIDAHTLEPDDRRLIALDGLRGVAVLLVMAAHFERFIPPKNWAMPLKTLMTYGWCGVDLFFALSGFLITGILLATRADESYLMAFYARRAIRIFPIYYATLVGVLVFAAVVPGFSDRVPPTWQWPFYFIYLTNWIPAFTGNWPSNVIGHFWSLAVEEQYYLIWPFVIMLFKRRIVAKIAITLAAIALVVRCIVVSTHGTSPAVELATITRCDALALGSLGAIYFSERQREAGIKLLSIAAFALGVFSIVIVLLPNEEARSRFWQTAGLSLLAISFSALVTHLSFEDGRTTFVQKVFRTAGLRRIGRYSYGMYVYHVPVLGICEVLLFRRLPEMLRQSVAFTLGYVLFLSVVTYVVASISYEVFERPILELKRNFRSKGAKRERPSAVSK